MSKDISYITELAMKMQKEERRIARREALEEFKKVTYDGLVFIPTMDVLTTKVNTIEMWIERELEKLKEEDGRD